MGQKYFIVRDCINIDRYLDLPIENTLVVYIDVWDVNTKYNKIKFSVFKNTYIDHEPKNIVLVGLNRMRKDSNRYDLIWQYLYKINHFDNRIVINDKPFNKEPWRLWYTYGFLFRKWINGENSFPLQGDYNKWFMRESDDCLISGNNIPEHISNTYTDLDLLHTKFEFYEPSKIESLNYSEIKNLAFEKKETPKSVLQFMSKGLKFKIDYELYLINKDYKLPNFGFYRFLCEENIRRMEIYNEIISNARKIKG